MFGLFKARPVEVLSHWYSLVPHFNASTAEFYQAIEQELKAREVPGLEINRVQFSEGGLLSDKREYLRMTREQLVFDICAAPFGNAYFFSCRFAEIPAVIKIWQLVLVLVAFWLITTFTWRLAGFWLGTFLLFAASALAIYTLRNAVAMGLNDLDATIIKSPVLGPLYERFFRKDTYYRQDTRLMYCDLVNELVKAKVEEITGAKGIKLVRFNEHSPILQDLYKPTTVPLPATAQKA